MGSMNTNNWLSFPLSPSHHASLPSQLQAPQSHQFSLGLVNDHNMDMNINPFQNQDWNMINTHGTNEVPKVADFLGVSKSDNETDLVAYNEPIQASDSDYIFSNNSLAPVVQQSSAIVAASNAYDFQENPSNLQALTLSMGSGKGSTETSSDNTTNSIVEATPRRTLDTFGQRTSIYRGVTRHRWTGRYEAHLWDNSCRREGQSRKGRQVYLGGYDKEEKAARAYDLAALKYWGTSTTTNFPISNYEKELEEMKHMTRQEFVASIRRKSSGFSRGASMYRGVTRHHQHGRWQARIGRVAGNKDLYLGTFSTEEEAAEAYDIAAIKFRGLNAVTNFDMNRYDVKSILESNTLPIGGGAAKRLKEAQALESSRKRDEMMALSSTFQYAGSSSAAAAAAGSSARLQAYPLLSQHAFDHHPHHHTLLSLQNHDHLASHYAATSTTTHHQDPSFHQSYIQTQLQLHQHSGAASFSNNGSQFSYSSGGGGYGSSAQNHPAFLQGLMDSIDHSSAAAGNSSGTTYNGSYVSNLGATSATNTGNNADQELALVKVDYDMPSGPAYGGWSASGSGQGSNPSVFTMWNE